MKVKIAIHKRGFSYRWIDYCKEKAIPYKVVNCFDNDIIANLKDVQGLLWNWSYGDLSDCMIARRLLPSVEAAGIKVFPNNKTSWYYDDKIAQKYLLEAIEAPLVPTYVFYNKKKRKFVQQKNTMNINKLHHHHSHIVAQTRWK